MSPSTKTPLDRAAVQAVYDRPLLQLVLDAALCHREHHDASRVQCSALLSIKTGACPEDCAYCPQSAHHGTNLEPERLMDVDAVLEAAGRAKDAGADRFCMGAARREVRDGKAFDDVLDMVQQGKALGLDTCATLGMVNAKQAARLEEAGLDYYNHNLDTAPEYYDAIISTRTFQERLDTLAAVREAGIKVCCGGIVGLGETDAHRVGLLHELAAQEPQPESVPINALVAVEGTPLENAPPLPWDVLVRTIATARLLMPRAVIRLSAGRTSLTDEAQALCFLAGANSIFLGEQLLTTPNPEPGDDQALLARLGLRTEAHASSDGA